MQCTFLRHAQFQIRKWSRCYVFVCAHKHLNVCGVELPLKHGAFLWHTSETVWLASMKIIVHIIIILYCDRDFLTEGEEWGSKIIQKRDYLHEWTRLMHCNDNVIFLR